MKKLACQACGDPIGYLPLKNSEGSLTEYPVPIVGQVPMYCERCVQIMYPGQVAK